MKNLNNARVNVMVCNMNQSLDFYIEKLGLKLIKHYGEQYAEVDANGFMIGLHGESPAVNRGNAVSIGLGVFHFDQTMELLEAKGIAFTLETGGYIRLAHFTDPDGNPLFLAENHEVS